MSGLSRRSWMSAAFKPFGSDSVAPGWIGLGLAVGYLLLHIAFDGLFLISGGFSSGGQPIWQSDQWWTDVVNGVMLAYLPAAQAIARRGVARDLAHLRSRLRFDEGEFEALREAAVGPSGTGARALGLSGVVLGAWLAFVDPTISNGARQSLGDPDFVWVLGRLMLLVWLIFRFSIYDFNTTRTYVALGRDNVEVDLLDLRSLAPFVHRGQRSALTWVLFSMLLSLFWLGDSAAQTNLPFLVVLLAAASWAFVAPLFALRHNILAVKNAELDRLREQIREEREQSRQEHSQIGPTSESPKLANAVAYYQLIEAVREWPVDAANLLRFGGYLLLGLGSWLGGAVVERILDSTLAS